MKVLQAINGLGAGGAERSLAEMLPHFDTLAVELIVACLNRRDEGVERAVLDAGTDVRFLDAKTVGGRVAQLRRIIRAETPDLLHTAIFDADVTGRLASVATKVPVLTSLVNTSYDPVRLEDPNVSAHRLTASRLIDGWTARRFNSHFHAITHAVKDAAVRDLGIRPSQVTVIERGRDPARLGAPSAKRRQDARRALGLGDDAEVLVTAGRQEYQKGQRYLVEAVRGLQDQWPNLVLLLAGRRGHATTELRGLRASLPRPHGVHFLGHRDDLPDVLAAADVFVFPSIYEGLGGALIEAMALGLPIIGSDISALREVVEPGSNALLVPPRAPKALQQAIARILTDRPEARAFGARSRAIYLSRFTLGSSVDRMAKLYRDIVSEQRPSIERPRQETARRA